MKATIVRYLVDHFGITTTRATELMLANEQLIADVVEFSAYYPAERIALSAQLRHSSPCATCEFEKPK